MHRHAFHFLNQWLQNSSRRPLVIHGARQVGKSTLVRLFAHSQQLELVEINLEEHSFKALKEEKPSVHQLIEEINILFRTSLNEKSLVFLMKFKKLLNSSLYFAIFMSTIHKFQSYRPDLS